MTNNTNIPVASPQPEARLSGQNSAGTEIEIPSVFYLGILGRVLLENMGKQVGGLSEMTDLHYLYRARSVGFKSDGVITSMRPISGSGGFGVVYWEGGVKFVARPLPEYHHLVTEVEIVLSPEEVRFWEDLRRECGEPTKLRQWSHPLTLFFGFERDRSYLAKAEEMVQGWFEANHSY